MRSVSWIGGLSLLSGGLAWSQTDTFVDNLGGVAAPVPVAQTPPPALQPVQTELVKPAKVETPAPAPQPVAAPAPRPQPVAAPAPKPQPVAAPAPAPQPTRTATPQPLPAPTVSVPDRKPASIPAALRDRPPVANQPGRATQTYVDVTTYGAESPATAAQPSNRPQLRPQVVVSDRNNGCQTQVSNGRLSQASCGVTPERTVRRPAPPPTMAVPGRLQQAPRLAQQQPPAPLQRHNKPGRSYSIHEVPQTPLAYLNRGQKALSRPAAYPNNNNRGLLFPLAIPSSISSTFGWRMHPIFGEWRMHTGTDIGAPQGTPVLASYHGQVAIAEYTGGYGQLVILRHEDGTQESRYAHLSEMFVQAGEWVEQGDVIGLVGSTGNSTGPHLHFEWRHLIGGDWVPVDAGPHLKWAMAEMQQVMTSGLTPEERAKAELGKIALGSGTLMLPKADELQPQKALDDVGFATEAGDTTSPITIQPAAQPLYRLDPQSGQAIKSTPNPALLSPNR
ncbi:peptidoglycan DD-metalloendopeptidase family protein [Spirulina subsalsa CS-330]|nr:peptidoglycan DD-metalloendopeptidase family protein [Spirulina subsalsa CS-330]